MKKNSTSRYKEVTKQLVKLIDTEYQDGGKLPPAPKMAELFGVSLVTYNKAQKLICREGLARASKNKNGTFVFPLWERRRKVGIVIDNGQHSPFLSSPVLLAAFMKTMSEFGFYLHILQGISIEEVIEKSELLSLLGVVWFDPPVQYLTKLEQITQSISIPIVFATDNRGFSDSNLSIFSNDLEHFIALKINTLKENYKSGFLIPYVKLPHKYLYQKYLQSNNMPWSDEYFWNLRRSPSRFLRQLEKLSVDTLLCDFGFDYLEALLETLCQLPDAQQPQIIANISSVHLARVHKKFPAAKIIGYFASDNELLGQTLAEKMYHHIYNKTPFITTSIKAVSYKPTSR